MKYSSKNEPELRKAMQQATQGQRTESRNILREAVHNDPTNYRAWLWLAYAAATNEEKRAALYRALQLNSTNDKVRQEFKRTYSPEAIQEAAQQGAFMCYSRADELFAVELAEQIKARHLPVWIDMLDVPMDADWNAAITTALENSGVVLVVLSPDLLASEESREEVAYSFDKGKIVLPLLHRDCDWQSLGLFHKPIDFRESANSGLRMVFALLGILNAPR